MALEKDELVRALIKTFRMSYGPLLAREIDGALEAVWPLFDSDGSGSIEMDEFVVRDGLCDTILASLALQR